LLRELSNFKEIQSDKIKEVESKKDAEVKMLEKVLTQSKKDKIDLEERIEDIIMKQDLINSRSAEEHHNTVKYFENLVA
jgi:hypothetical protein